MKVSPHIFVTKVIWRSPKKILTVSIQTMDVMLASFHLRMKLRQIFNIHGRMKVCISHIMKGNRGTSILYDKIYKLWNINRHLLQFQGNWKYRYTLIFTTVYSQRTSLVAHHSSYFLLYIYKISWSSFSALTQFCSIFAWW